VWSLADKGALEPGKDGDLVLVDPEVGGPLPLEWLQSRAGWSPYEGWPLAGWPVVTVLRGRVAWEHRVEDGATRPTPFGAPLRFA
jgi:dihydroorotase